MFANLECVDLNFLRWISETGGILKHNVSLPIEGRPPEQLVIEPYEME